MAFWYVRRDAVLMVLLCVGTVPLFLFTSGMAARSRARNVAVANDWYLEGQKQLRSGKTQQAIESFRNAASGDRDNKTYTLALAGALIETDRIDEASSALFPLKASSPDNSEVNLNLARLAVRAGRNDDAIRYYRSALYGVSRSEDSVVGRSKVRAELVQSLLAIKDRSNAQAELLLLVSDLPDDCQSHDSAGRLFLEAGDPRHALAQFAQALQLNAEDPEALDGAGYADFELGDYVQARQYLEAALVSGIQSSQSRDLLETSQLILARDPFVLNLRLSERVKRFSDDLRAEQADVESCIASKQDDGDALDELQPLLVELSDELTEVIRPKALRPDSNRLRTGFILIQRAETLVSQTCAGTSPLQRALLLIAEKSRKG